MEDFLFDAKSPSNAKGKANDNAFQDIRSNLQKETGAGSRKPDSAAGLAKKKDSPRAGG